MNDKENNLQPEAPKENEKEMTFTFKITEINLVLAGLEELPHKVSRKLIDNIFQQAQTQSN